MKTGFRVSCKKKPDGTYTARLWRNHKIAFEASGFETKELARSGYAHIRDLVPTILAVESSFTANFLPLSVPPATPMAEQPMSIVQYQSYDLIQAG